ncbi:MAG: hypothetical protein V3U42_12810 [candidate division NC10 bacterium]|nr:hypothetical protein [candidate division NC10 bacterium]MCH7897682.1 hypothetical protein [candidate division NC10 bacterium]MCZ6550434.1 hypothetical protein [candidate division NC10 bacterium]
MDEQWNDAEIRALIERIAMERRRRELKARAKRRQPRRLVPKAKRILSKDVRRPAGMMAKKRRLAG